MPSTPLLSPYLQSRRFQAVKPFLIGDVLDLGCGQAELAAWLEPGQIYYGVEGDEVRVARLRDLFPAWSFLSFDLDQDRLDVGRQFDTITMIAVIEHLNNPSNLLTQLPALLTPNGHLVITTPSPLGDRVHRMGARLGLFSMIAVESQSNLFASPYPLFFLILRLK
jgi:2-polyprenyl-3-methyl-5-hydroxy-6-metoxy-1,4-benzoquinol methylase